MFSSSWHRTFVAVLSVGFVVVCGYSPVETISSASAQAAKGNSVVAVVNADPITRQMLADATLQRYGTSVLDNVIINRQLILQACEDRGITVTTQEVEAEITRLAKKFNFAVQDYLQLLQKERNISPGQYGREIIWPMLSLRKLVADQVAPTQEEFNEAYLAQYGEAIKCRMIMVSTKEKAAGLLQEVTANPQQFGQIAKQKSEDEVSASVNGLIPPIRRYTGDRRLEDAAFGLKDGEISPLIEIANQYVILQRVRHIPKAIHNPQAMAIIREQITDRIRDQKMKGAAAELFSKLQIDAKLVKVFGDEELSKQYPGIAAIVNGQKITIAQLAAECVKRHGEEVLDGEINRKLLQQALAASKKEITDQDLHAEIARAAISYGMIRPDGTADVAAWIQSVTSDGETTQEIYIQDAVWPSVVLKKIVEDRVNVTEEDIRRGFESNYGPRVEILACVLGDLRTAQKIWKMARDNPTDAFFGQLAQQYSVETVSASNSGKVPPIRRFSGQPAIEEAAFKLETGELSGIVETGNKYIILKCQGRTKPVVNDLEAVRDELHRSLLEKNYSIAMADEFDRLKEDSEIDNFFVAAKEIASIGKPSPANRK